MEINKKCEVCGRLLPESEFSKSYKHRCKKCVAKQTKEKRDNVKYGRIDKIFDEYFSKKPRPKKEIITITIPAGVAGGMQLTVPGKGNAAPHGGVNGDLLVLIEEEEHKDFVRQESDLIYNLLLDMPTAVLGGQVQIPTLTGDVKITITPGTQPGKVLRMRGKGLPRIDQYGRNYGVGDLLINVGVYIPEKLNKDERKLIEQLQSSPNIVPGAADKKNFFRNLFGI